MSSRSEAIEIAARPAFDAFYAEGTPYTEIERAMFTQVAAAVYDALLSAGVIPAEGAVVVTPKIRCRTCQYNDGLWVNCPVPIRNRAGSEDDFFCANWTLLHALAAAPTGEGTINEQ